ncbi:2-oxoglutarate and iron-dependent oxygenase domain-containing protein, partial [bacterium]|nr:2-oxoglutarate and iron-dependent oxygenase domain-containing protein [bacterium]
MPGILEEAMIPTIDLTGLGTPGCADHGRIAAQLVDIYSTVGFAYLSNHGVDEAVVEAAFEASRKFHALPLASKMAIEVNEYHRGYIPINTSTTTTSSVATVTKPNQSASLMLMHEVSPDSELARAGAPLAGPNQWPSALPEINAPLLAYVRAMT